MRKKILPVLGALLCLLLSGCAMRTVEQLYCPPRRSAEFSSLQSAIDQAMAGMEYAAPMFGENQQTVQRADVDGDGTDEYLVYARSSTEAPLHILLFRADTKGNFFLAENINCKGTSFEQVEYVELDGKPGTDVLVGLRIGGQSPRIASLYSFAEGASEQIFSTLYNRVATCDLDGNGKKELLVIRYGESELDSAVALLYRWQNGVRERSREAALSGRAEAIKRISMSTLQDGQPAVYVTSEVEEGILVTDIFAVKKNVFSNISLNAALETRVETLQNYYIYAEDIDNDGIMELPRLLSMKSTNASDAEKKQSLICWYSVDMSGTVMEKCYTFHNYDGGWYLNLDSSWINRVAMERSNSSCIFYIWNENYGEAQKAFTITALTGPDRDEKAAENNHFALYRGESVVYAARLETVSALYGITQDYLTNSFHLIQQDLKITQT